MIVSGKENKTSICVGNDEIIEITPNKIGIFRRVCHVPKHIFSLYSKRPFLVPKILKQIGSQLLHCGFFTSYKDNIKILPYLGELQGVA